MNKNVIVWGFLGIIAVIVMFLLWTPDMGFSKQKIKWVYVNWSNVSDCDDINTTKNSFSCVKGLKYETRK